MIALLIPLPWMQGCTKAGVAQDIVNWTPALQSAVATVDSTAALLVPVDAPIFITATVGFDAATNLLVAQAKAYLANPSGSLLEAAGPDCDPAATGECVAAAGGKDCRSGKPGARAERDSGRGDDCKHAAVAGGVGLEARRRLQR